MESSSAINVVVWAETRDRAAVIAQALTEGNESNEVWIGQESGATVRAYIRYSGVVPQASPQGITDILVVDVSGMESSFLEEARQYVNTRKGISFKFVTSAEDLSEWAKELGVEFLSASEVVIAETRSKLVSSVVTLNETLRSTFDTFDLNKNGAITAEELVKASIQLGHELNSDEAKNIANSLSKDGNITFPQFKQWWVMGKGDFNTFRRLTQFQTVAGGYLRQGSEVFNAYLNKLKEETEMGQSHFVSRINIGPTEEFESGFGFNVDVAGGKDYENVMSVSPDYFKSSPLTLGVEIRVLNEEAGALLLQTMEGLKGMIFAIPKIQEIMQIGLNVNLRQVGTSVFIDLSLGGMLADQALQTFAMFDFEQLNFAGTGNFSIFSGLRLTDILEGSVEDLINRVTLLKVESHSEYSNIKTLFYAIASVYESFSHNVPRKLRKFISLIKFLGAIRNLGYEFKYDATELASILKEAVGDFASSALQMESEVDVIPALNMQLQGMQGMGIGMIGNFKPMIESVLEPFKEPLLAVDYDRLSIFTVVPKMKFYYKTTINLPGITTFLQANVLN